LQLAEKDPAYHSACKTIIAKMENSDDRDFVSSWLPESASPVSVDPPTSATEEKPPQADQEKQPENAATTNQAPPAVLGQDSGSHPQEKSSDSADAPAPEPEENTPPPEKEIPQDNAATSDPTASADCDLNSPPEAHFSESADPPVPAADENPPQAETEIHHDDAAVVEPSPAPQPLAISAATSGTQKKRRSPSQDHLFSAPLPKRDVGVNSDEIPT
jgi:hypothetical protein